MSPQLAVGRDQEAQFDSALSRLPCFDTKYELYLSPLLPSEFVLAKHYVESFPHQALLVGNRQKASEAYLLSPTCCYPVFRHLEGSAIEEPFLVTHKNTCFRSEEHYKLGERQGVFLMREYILFSSNLDHVKNWIEMVKHDVLRMLLSLGIEAQVEKASDPFFNPNDFRQKFQASENLKSEFVFGDIALGSVNLHLKSFSKSCQITATNREPLYSACFGLGYDRVAAVLDRLSHAA